MFMTLELDTKRTGKKVHCCIPRTSLNCFKLNGSLLNYEQTSASFGKRSVVWNRIPCWRLLLNGLYVTPIDLKLFK